MYAHRATQAPQLMVQAGVRFVLKARMVLLLLGTVAYAPHVGQDTALRVQALREVLLQLARYVLLVTVASQ